MRIRLSLMLIALSALYGSTWVATTSTVASQSKGRPAILELRLSSKEFPNPNSPFWIGPQQLGLVSVQQVKRDIIGATFVYDLQTRTAHKLLERPVVFPTKLRREDRISYVDAPGSRGLTLYTMSLTGGSIQEYDFNRSSVFDPSWSPDGNRVVFADASYNADLVIAEGGSQKILPESEAPGAGTDTAGLESPDWSPDGVTIVYVGWDSAAKTSGGHQQEISRLYTCELSSRQNHVLTTGTFQDRHPAYSPDGTMIAFVSNRSGPWELWMIEKDGTHMRRLTDMAGRGQQVFLQKPSWSPDQSRIAFTTVPASRNLDKGGFLSEGSRVWILRVVR